MKHKRLWWALALVVVSSFAVLTREGGQIEKHMPPIPARVVTTAGVVVTDGEAIRRGQNVWQSLGGQQVGSIWGHGAYQAPDWSADWLHRESEHVLNAWATAEGATGYLALPAERQAALKERLAGVMRTNTYDPATGTITLTPERAAAYQALSAHFTDVFLQGRGAYAIPQGALKDASRAADMMAFFWWTSWATTTNRPNGTISYTQNWPHEPLVKNTPAPGAVMWSIWSVIALLAGVGGLVWYYGSHKEEEDLEPPAKDPFSGMKLTPSQRATFKYFAVVALLFVLQIVLGVITAHYGVEGKGFYGMPLDKFLPYSVTRSWHTQIGIFWIATAWLATGLFVGPAISGKEPKYQALGVNVLFGALLVVVGGTLVGQWMSIQQKLGGDTWYWLGHQGYEYVDLGRVWQILLWAGLFIWLALTARGIWPALKKPGEGRALIVLFLISAVAIASFYGYGFMYGQKSHLSKVEYWRWWVVHLWVEGFFEVFATVVLAFLFTRLGVLRPRIAVPTVIFATTIFLAGGILGTLHHLYFSGSPSSTLALGSVFSALEIVPLVLVGREVWSQYRLTKRTDWLKGYKWPIMFGVAVAFWNLVGAGLFGFLINPPIALYYMQGLNLTPVHGHTALFGVYGMLGIALLLFTLRMMNPEAVWKTRALAFAFWSINGGLVLMVVLSLLPIGILQTSAAMEHGLWFARSAEFMNTPLMQTLKWLRAPGDTLFGLGSLGIAWFVIGFKTGWSFEKSAETEALPGGVMAPAPMPVARRQ